jgi:hydrogenase/urease accessory protein HupE
LDHILFVLGIFLLSRSWKPLLLQVTTFTLAHSVTLALAALGAIKASERVVEPVIAASIAVVALENIFKPEYSRWRLGIVFIFGLIHGLGFASALGELDIPTGSFAVALTGFNLGVEGGQLAVIAGALLLTSAIRNPDTYRKIIVIPGSVAIALTGIYWAIQRTLA